MNERRNKEYNECFMKRAFSLALKAKTMTSPNPMVGCVIEKKGRIVGEGYHKKAGLPHAEVEALKKVRNPEGCTMYVTLEPCDHHGKTPPCTDQIIRKKIKKVVISKKDPNKINNGRGIKKLKNNGIRVLNGVLEEYGKSFYQSYFKFIKKKMPFITLKLAQSLDGKIATKQGDSRWISSELSRNFVQKLRAESDGVMVGVNTVIKDDPMLIPRIGLKRKITRIVVDTHLRIPLNSRLVRSSKVHPLIIAVSRSASASKQKKLNKKNINIIKVGIKKNKIDLKQLMRMLAKEGIMNLLVEGGGELAGSMLDEKLVDKAMFFITPAIIGGRGAVNSISGEGIKKIKDMVTLADVKVNRFGKDIMLEGLIKR